MTARRPAAARLVLPGGLEPPRDLRSTVHETTEPSRSAPTLRREARS